jgi:menaquinone-dependent protoporphyrinogen IX oxidase
MRFIVEASGEPLGPFDPRRYAICSNVRSMNPILIVFESRFGQCAAIAERIAERVRDRGRLATVLHAGVAAGADLARYSGVVVVAPVYFGGYPRTVTRLLRKRQVPLAERPFAFVSVGNAAASADREVRAEAERGLSRLLAETGVSPDVLAMAGGAISYPRYGAFLRLAMKLHAFVTGAPTDTAMTHELTDWDTLDRALLPFLARFDGPRERAEASGFDESGVHRIPGRGAVSALRER